jgi:hypothetical protein
MNNYNKLKRLTEALKLEKILIIKYENELKKYSHNRYSITNYNRTKSNINRLTKDIKNEKEKLIKGLKNV